MKNKSHALVYHLCSAQMIKNQILTFFLLQGEKNPDGIVKLLNVGLHRIPATQIEMNLKDLISFFNCT